jgi:hypothetical protein
MSGDLQAPVAANNINGCFHLDQLYFDIYMECGAWFIDTGSGWLNRGEVSECCGRRVGHDA